MTRKTGEFERIARIFEPLAAGFPGAFGLTDDAAVIRPDPGNDLVVTTDTIVAGVHYRGDEAPAAIAQKLLRVNLSDLAAMGARPRAYTLNVALPGEVDDPWLDDFADGLGRDQDRYGICLAGGDSVGTTGPVTLTVTAFGEAPQGKVLLRSGAKPGHGIYVSGTVGDSALGLLGIDGHLSTFPGDVLDALATRYRLPEPRVALGPELIGLASSAADVSDGLVADLRHIADASHCAAVLDSARVPLSPGASRVLRDRPGLLETVLTGGDDYEILFTVPPVAASAVGELADRLGLALTRIGEMVTGTGVRVLAASGAEMELHRQGWVHG